MSETEKTRKIDQVYNDGKPWGEYTVLVDEPDHKVKTLTVDPGSRLSLQRHRHRQEHWFIVRGTATVTVGEPDCPVDRLETRTVGAGEFVDIPKGHQHRMANEGDEPVVFIEVQTGEYFGEDDNIRIEDDYDRGSPEFTGADGGS